MKKEISMYICFFFASILLICVNVFAQKRVNTFNVFSAQTDDYSIVKINTNTNEKIYCL